MKIFQLLEWIFGLTYFVKYLRGYLQKNGKGGGGSDKYEIWCVEQLGRAKKKFKIAFLSDQPFMEQISFTICIIKQIFGEVFISHIELVLNIFVTFCPFSD